MSLTPQALLAELDATLPQASESWRGAVLRQITDLFLNSAELYSDQQVALFDAVMSRLIMGVDRAALAELSSPGWRGSPTRRSTSSEASPAISTLQSADRSLSGWKRCRTKTSSRPRIETVSIRAS
jgi:hypothetical protein